SLSAGAGYGGSCFPKDVNGLAATAASRGIDAPVIGAIDRSNVLQRQRMIAKLRDLVESFSGRTICILGLSFKPGTDDIREAPALNMISTLLAEGAVVRAYDPVANDRARAQFADLVCCEDPYQAAAGADAVVLMTEWNEFRNIDLPRILAAVATPPRFLDCRNIYDPREMLELGFEYVSIGRPRRIPGESPQEDVSAWALSSRFSSLRS
ncbi:MAG TPA: UDP-glucose/GDP-mannose dehydrogenase family protein, partial [Candidatus Latescibacteria bacterium]|nr:UDP-glucose/GDP-mannose dehydrogenase family protein [Candidatus Latescibacterota bacterium]